MSPRFPVSQRCRVLLGAMLLSCLLTGCTTLHEFIDNGYKVGPNYARPPAAVAQQWIDQADNRIRTEPEEHRQWWKVFKDPILDDLICAAYQQNLSLRDKSFKVLEEQAILGTVLGRLFPQNQVATGSFTQVGLSKQVANRQFILERFYPQWASGLSLSWELDFWGKYRRAIEAAEANLAASIEDYDDVLVNVLAQVATAYTQYRILEKQLELVRANIQLQEATLKIASARFKGGLVTELDVDQAESTLQQTKAIIPQLEAQQRIQQNQLCVLLGIPPVNLNAKLGKASIPQAPPEVILGVPADLLRRRPDVRRAEREAASRCAIIGIRESEFYPAVSIDGSIGYQSQFFSHLFTPGALAGSIGPSFNWKILNYGRLANDVLRAEADFQGAVVRYQNTVLSANQEVENGVVRFLNAQQQTRELSKSVQAAEKAVIIAMAQYKAGQVDFNRVSVIQQNLVQQQDSEAQAFGEIAQGLIAVYKGLGGGWQIRLDGCVPCPTPATTTTAPAQPTLTIVPAPSKGL